MGVSAATTTPNVFEILNHVIHRDMIRKDDMFKPQVFYGGVLQTLAHLTPFFAVFWTIAVNMTHQINGSKHLFRHFILVERIKKESILKDGCSE